MSDSTAKQRLWVVTEVYYPEQISTGYYLTSIAEGLAPHLDVKVLAGQPNYGSRGLTAPKHEHRKDVEIFRAPSTRLDKNVIPFRVLNMLTLGLSMFFKSLKLFKSGDRVLVVTAPPSLPFTTALAALIKGSSYTLLLHDSYPEILVAVGKAKARSVFVRTVNIFNRWLYKHAAKIIVVGRDMHDLLTAKTAGLDIPIVTIPNWADLEVIIPEYREENTLLAELNIESKFVFMYAGNIGHPTDIETIIEAAEKLQGDDRFHFVFIGSGAKKPWLVDAVGKRELGNVIILDQRPRTDQSVFLNACDIGIISLVPGMLGTAMPSRTYNILAAGKPILALTDEGSELAQVIDEEQVGWHIRPRQPEILVKTILEIFDRKNELAEMGERARAAAEVKYSLADALRAYRGELGN
ncbi:MAG: glycosyltransferase family 4 protein [Acidobacteriota bacterium]